MAVLPLMLFVLASQHAPALARTTADKQSTTCGFQSCHEVKAGMLNVHMVPHSHDDLGWHKTVAEYFYGRKNYVQDANVSMILDSVFNELMTDPAKRYIQVETAYLWMWWQHQSETTRNQYRELVQTGRLQITGGGWSMPDEATTNYQSLIDNFSWGFKFLNDSFGPCGVPNVGWQIDPFGHSRETASIMAAMGLQGTFLNRVDYQDFERRNRTQELELLWRASSNAGPEADLFTNILYGMYTPPLHLCWDILCGEPGIVDADKAYQDYIVGLFTDYVNNQARHYRTNNVLITMGSDFTYMDAPLFYSSIDKLISLVNHKQKKGGKLNVLYSTPSCYLKAVHDSRPTIPVKTDDFLPYASEANTYWTGYYTSRPTIKFLERLGNNFLQVCKQLSVLARLSQDQLSPLDDLRSIMGILQHHDAITGTERKHVVTDYVRTLNTAMSRSHRLAQAALNVLLSPDTSSTASNTTLPKMKSCLLLNISQCDVSEQNENFIATVYNPLSRAVSHYVRLPVKNGSYSVTDLDGATQATQRVPIPSPVLQLNDRHSNAHQELVFRAADIPPLGLRSYRVSRTSSSNTATGNQLVADSHIGNNDVSVELDAETGLVARIVAGGEQIPLSQDMFYYESYDALKDDDGSLEEEDRSDGAYMFKPRNNTAVRIAKAVDFSVYKGEIVEEIHQTFNKWVSQVIRICKEEDHVEFEWLVGPIQIGDRGIEPISRFSSGLGSDGVFYTDSNGRELLRRRRNYRASWNVSISQPVAGNYFPVTSRIVLKDKEKGLELAVLTDRAQGGGSLADGQLELMLHRRLKTDDGLGVDEFLDDAEPARGKHYMVAGRSSASVEGGVTLAAKERQLARRKLLQPWVFLSPADEWPSDYKHQYSGLKAALSDNVHLLTLEPWGGDDVFLLRLEHVMERGDDPLLSRNITVDVKDIFDPASVRSMRETTLDGSQWLSDVKRLSWMTTEGGSDAATPPALEGTSVSLTPMQIRTFIVTVGEHDT